MKLQMLREIKSFADIPIQLSGVTAVCRQLRLQQSTTEKVNVICTSAYEGDVDAQYDLGIMFIVGEAVVQDQSGQHIGFLKPQIKIIQEHSGLQD